MDELEDLLKGYRPAGPPAELRARITALGGSGDANDRRGVMARWLLVAATLCCAVLFYALAAREHQRIAMRLPPPIPVVSPEPPTEPWP